MLYQSLFSIRVLSLCAVLMVAACASKVPLNEPAQVEDRTGQAVAVAGKGVTGSDGRLQARDVSAVDVTNVPVDATGNTVYFDFDSYAIKPQFQALLEVQAKRLKANHAAKIVLSGHTDEMGGREYNLALGQKRAEAVKRSLSILGVQELQMEAVSYGKEKPVVAGFSDAAGEKNRRVEIASR
jgi:peptidoglycan-associated lipoprotein